MSSQRIVISTAQKKALQTHYFSYSKQKPLHNNLTIWFQEQYGHTLHQSSISCILSKAFVYPDVEMTTGQQIAPDTKKACHLNWPELKLALNNWVTRMEENTNSHFVTLLDRHVKYFFLVNFKKGINWRLLSSFLQFLLVKTVLIYKCT